jgi:hypothetical protein
MKPARGTASSVQPAESIFCFVDGSFWKDSRSGREYAGAGLFYKDGDERNRCIPVPRSTNPALPYNSTRAELYAALAFIDRCQFDPIVSPSTRRTLYTDCLVARHLLLVCRFGATRELAQMRPSKWAASTPGLVLSRTFVFGEEVGPQTVLLYADVLDWWWMCSRFYCHDSRSMRPLEIEVEWVKAHQDAPASSRTRDKILWEGNAAADRLAKVGAKLRFSKSDLELFAGYPLFRKDPEIAHLLPPQTPSRLNYLPLLPEPHPVHPFYENALLLRTSDSHATHTPKMATAPKDSKPPSSAPSASPVAPLEYDEKKVKTELLKQVFECKMTGFVEKKVQEAKDFVLNSALFGKEDDSTQDRASALARISSPEKEISNFVVMEIQEMLMRRSQTMPKGFPSCHIDSVKGSLQKALGNSRLQKNVLQNDIVLLPILCGRHFTLYAIDRIHKNICVFDSMPLEDRPHAQEGVFTILNWIHANCPDLRSQLGGWGFTMSNGGAFQKGDVECGMHLLAYEYFLTLGVIPDCVNEK